jgi:uncharacterized protein (DUF2384 family)
MSAVYRPEDVLKGRKWMRKKAAKDLTPEQAERVEEILQRWDKGSERELVEFLGREKARRLLDDLRRV